MNDNTYYHSDNCNMMDLKKLFRSKPHLEVLLKGRRWRRVRRRIKKMDRNVAKRNISCIDI